MTPTVHEEHVAALLNAEGWDAWMSPPRRDFGLDVVCEQLGRRLGVQVKMYGSGRPVNAQIVMQLHGAASYQDCTEAMLVTDGRVLEDARQVAAKLNIKLRHVPIPGPNAFDGHFVASDPVGVNRTFDGIWKEYLMPLVGQVLTGPDGSISEVVSVDWSGLKRRTSTGSAG